MDKVKDFIVKYKYPLAIALCVIIIIAGYFIWQKHHTQTITTESQTQAETPAGVEQAAENARVSISTGQAEQVATQIKYIYSHDVQPVYTVTTTGSKVQKAAETAQEAAGADFSIITDKPDPTETTDLKTLPAASTVELNQYNVQAYKKVLNTVEVGTNDFHSVDEVGYTVSKKISKDGKYVGIGASYNFDDEKAMVKVSYTW